LPSGLGLVIIARVVLVENDSGREQGSARVSLDFENLHEADREILIKHIHGKQLESLSNAKET
jgi:c-di-GMP-binding flagellar brake protein YcgR